MSRPWSSVPSQNVPPRCAGEPGGSLLSMMSICARSYGFCGEISGAKIAASDDQREQREADDGDGIARGSRSRSGANGDASVRAARDRRRVDRHVRSGGAHVPPSGQSHARIERRVEDVDEQVDDDEERHDHQQVRDDHRPVEQVDRVDQQLAHAGPREHALGDDRKRDQRTELQADHGDDRESGCCAARARR